MKFYKTLFFEIPNKDFIMPIYKEENINTLKSFLEDDEVLFSIGYKTQEDESGYYIGQVKAFTDVFRLGDFPLVYRKRVLDVLKGLQDFSKGIDLEQKILELVYFQMTKNGLKSSVIHYSEENLLKLKRMDILDYFTKEISVFVISDNFHKDGFLEGEIFYKIKNPNI